MAFFTTKVSGQDEEGWIKRVDFGIEKSVYADVSIYSAYWQTKKDSGFLISGDTEFVVNRNFLVAPKISTAYVFDGVLIARTDFSLYTDFNKTQPVATPKIGVGLLGFYFYYGRNISLNNNSFSALGKNQFTIGFSAIPKIVLNIIQ
ncbi:hypothetical protein ABIB40_002306 [Pedobacter sp. UYP30]|uniref:hypothetical protein n=1 Tax=Pedobacter sp. UYP30 TaxID=1756400 RepID=UPI003394B183